MLSFKGLLSLYNTFSATNHFNLALATSLLLFILYGNQFVLPANAISQFHSITQYVIPGVMRLKKFNKQLYLACIILIVLTLGVLNPSPGPPVQISQHQLSIALPAHELSTAALPVRTNSETRSIQKSETLFFVKALPSNQQKVSSELSVRTESDKDLLTSSDLINVRRYPAKSWLCYVCQLLDLPPPLSSSLT